ncbi:DUF4824 family protein [Campylobacterota bacterium DY0563]
MRCFFNSNKLFILAFAFIITSNIVILYGVFNNRTGLASSEVSLTERELKLPYLNINENSAISLRLNFRTLNNFSYTNKNAPWLTTQKLKTLGFYIDKDFKKSNGSHFFESTQKEVFIVLEYDGKSYQDSLALAKNRVVEIQKLNSTEKKDQQKLKHAIEELKNEQYKYSRLFAIDADINPEVLKSKYQDKSKYIITRGLINVRHTSKGISAYISGLIIEKIYIPLEYSNFLKSLQSINNYNNKIIKPRYTIILKYGTKFEPYVTSVKKLN